ncbi:hypothetical protein BDI4_70073 [Burkholderia diffusa]|nr:hypothetical protein BDI4_70073 [Burkholderia diffusa]
MGKTDLAELEGVRLRTGWYGILHSPDGWSGDLDGFPSSGLERPSHSPYIVKHRGYGDSQLCSDVLGVCPLPVTSSASCGSICAGRLSPGGGRRRSAAFGQNWTLDGNPGIVNNQAIDHEMRLNSNHGQILSPRTDPIHQTE